MICPVCNGNEKMVEKDNYHVCPKCLTEVWPPEKPERGEYKKKRRNIKSGFDAMAQGRYRL